VGRASPALAAFNAGEFSPQMEGRVDVEKYPIATHIQQNFIPLKQGPATFRPGSAYTQAVKNSANRTWLKSFEFSQSQAFLLEFGDYYVRFYTNHGPLLSTGNAAYSNATAYVLGNQVVSGGITYYCIAPTTGNAPPNATYWYPMSAYNGSATTAIYEIPSPYAVADLTSASGNFQLDIQQQGDVLYICAGVSGGAYGLGYAPQTLTRYANNPPDWQFAQYAPTDGPFLSAVPLVPGSEIALTVSATSGTGVTVNAYGGNLFAATDVGRLIRIASGYYNVTPWNSNVSWAAGATCTNNGNNYLALNAATSGGAAPVHTAGSALDGPTGVRWLYTDSGYGIGQITAYTSPTQVTVTVLSNFPANVVGATAAIAAITQANPAVVSCTNTFTAGEALFITGVAGMTQVNGKPYTNQTASGSTVTLAGINSTNYTAYTSGGTIIGNATVEWQLGAWSNTTEWPRAAAFYKDRLFLAGKLTLWGSVPGLYTSQAQDFNGVQTTDAGINVIVSGSDSSNIVWLSSNIILLIGTQGGEYGLDAANQSSPLGPTNVEVLPQSQWRCRTLGPQKIGTSLLYAQRAGRKVFAADYNFYLNRYDSSDQSKFAYHITIGGLVQMAYQQEPWSILWCTRADGTLLSYTFNREDNVTAWARHNLGNNGVCESIAVIPAPDGLRDELWMIVNRTVNGATIRTVEYVVKPFEGPQAGQAGDAQSSCWYVDCGVQSVASGAITVTGASVVQTGVSPLVFTIQAVNSLVNGQTVLIAGINYTGTANPNGSWTVYNVSPTSFQFQNVNALFGTLTYISGGTVSLSQPSQGSTTVSNLPAVMYNQTVAVFADGGVQPQGVVSSTGTLTVAGTFNVVTVGFPYQGNLVPMRIEGGADVGTAQGKKKKGSELVIRLVDSGGGVIGQLSNQNATTQLYQDPLGLTQLTPLYTEQIVYNYTTTALDSPPPLQSGDFPVSFPLQTASDQDESDFYLLVQQNLPLPMTVVGLFPSYEVQEPR